MGLFFCDQWQPEYLLQLCNSISFSKEHKLEQSLFQTNDFIRNPLFNLDLPHMSQHSLCDAPPTLCSPSQACAPPRVRPLLSTHPATVPPCVCTHPAPILQHGCWENTSCHLCHVIVHNNAKFLQVRVRAPDHAVAFDLGKEERVKVVTGEENRIR